MEKFKKIFYALSEQKSITKDNNYGFDEETSESEALVKYGLMFIDGGYDKIKNSKISGEMFEFAINSGDTKLGVILLQRSYNTLNKNIQLKEDGILGEMTSQAVNFYKFYKSLFKVMNILQGMYYISRAEKVEDEFSLKIQSDYESSPESKEFLRFWIDKKVSF